MITVKVMTRPIISTRQGTIISSNKTHASNYTMRQFVDVIRPSIAKFCRSFQLSWTAKLRLQFLIVVITSIGHVTLLDPAWDQNATNQGLI